VLYDALAPVLVGAQQHLGVGIALEAVAHAFQLGAQLAEVVDLAVEREREALALVAHRLEGAVGIDDRQAPVPRITCCAVDGASKATMPAPSGPRCAMASSMPLDAIPRDAERGPDDDACDAAHGYSLSARCAAPRPASSA
jgi:hypothetical protein